MATSAYGPSTRTARHDASRAGRQTRPELSRIFAAVVGAVFLLVGILGFVPGITENLDDIELAGHESGAELLGVFQVSILHNIVHLLFGIAGLAAYRHAGAARTYLLAGGVIYLLLAAYGFAIDHGSDANFVPVNDADDWLHTGLGIGMIALGLIGLADAKRHDHVGHDVRT